MKLYWLQVMRCRKIHHSAVNQKKDGVSITIIERDCRAKLVTTQRTKSFLMIRR